MRINGYPQEQKTWARVSGYVEQSDIHSPQVGCALDPASPNANFLAAAYNAKASSRWPLACATYRPPSSRAGREAFSADTEVLCQPAVVGEALWCAVQTLQQPWQ